MRTLDKFQYRRTKGVEFNGLPFLLCVLTFLHGASLPLHGAASAERPTEAQVKAAYLYNFGKFVRWQWPTTGVGTFDICVLGRNPFGATLTATVAGETIDGKNIVTRNIGSIQELSPCKILFISLSEEGRLKPVLAAAKRSGTLTVSDIPNFAQNGGMIELVNQEGRIRFEVNLAAANGAGLTVSSELLKVAVKVIGTDQARETGK